METDPQPAQRPLTRRDLPAILAALGFMAALVVLAAAGRLLEMLALLGIGGLLLFRSMSPLERETLAREIERREQTLLGRVLRPFELAVGVLLLYLVARALLGR